MFLEQGYSEDIVDQFNNDKVIEMLMAESNTFLNVCRQTYEE